jgi:hypothetical protein
MYARTLTTGDHSSHSAMWTPSSAIQRPGVQGTQPKPETGRNTVALLPLPCAAQRHHFLEKRLTATWFYRTLYALSLQSITNTRVIGITRYAEYGQTHVNVNLL